MPFPPPPRRPQAYRIRRRAGRGRNSTTWSFCVAALALVALILVLGGASAAHAAPRPRAAPAGVRSGEKPTWGAAADGLASAIPDALGTAEVARAEADSLDTPAAGARPRAEQGRTLRVQLTAYSASVERSPGSSPSSTALR